MNDDAAAYLFRRYDSNPFFKHFYLDNYFSFLYNIFAYTFQLIIVVFRGIKRCAIPHEYRATDRTETEKPKVEN